MQQRAGSRRAAAAAAPVQAATVQTRKLKAKDAKPPPPPRKAAPASGTVKVLLGGEAGRQQLGGAGALARMCTLLACMLRDTPPLARCLTSARRVQLGGTKAGTRPTGTGTKSVGTRKVTAIEVFSKEKTFRQKQQVRWGDMLQLCKHVVFNGGRGRVLGLHLARRGVLFGGASRRRPAVLPPAPPPARRAAPRPRSCPASSSSSSSPSWSRAGC